MNKRTWIVVGLGGLALLWAVAWWMGRPGQDEPDALPNAKSATDARNGGVGDIAATGEQRRATGTDRRGVVDNGSARPAVTPVPGRQSTTRTTTTTSPASGFGETVAHAGQMVQAVVTVGEQVEQLTPNQVGNFPRVYVAARQKVTVRLSYPEARPGATVVTQAMDGGRLADDQIVQALTLDDQRMAQFSFTASQNEGTHRVVLVKGADKKQLDFWVGEETPIARE